MTNPDVSEADVAQTSRPCDLCGTAVPRTKPTAPIPRFCSDDCKPRCSVDGCDGPARKRGWCASHYAQWQRTGTEPVPFVWKWGQASPRPYIPRPKRSRRRRGRSECSVPECSEFVRGNGFCSKHQARFLRNGDPNIVQRVWHEMQPCAVCGSEEREIKSRNLCSKKCMALYYRHGGEVPAHITCVRCGAVSPNDVTTRSGKRRQVTRLYCDSCSAGAWRSNCLTVAELAARDGATCSLCGEGVDMTLRRADSLLCPSVDHVTPRSRGGNDEPANLALAHLICNIRKSNRVT